MDFSALEDLDSFAELRNGLRNASEKMAEYAGIPIPIDGEQLIIEPSYPYAIIGHQDDDEASEIKIRNSFWSKRYRATIYVWQEPPDKTIRFGLAKSHRIDMELRTLGVSVAWGIEQEYRALTTLGAHIDHHKFKTYLLTGSFLETSRRSGITYLFRKLRPTIALSTKGDRIKILCALCMHPIGYYANSWGGAMCPTDDVIAHLMLMRGDEVMLWRRCNQHPSHAPEAGL